MYVVDKFHLHQYIRRATAHVENTICFQLQQALYGNDIVEARKIHKYLLEKTTDKEKARIKRINDSFKFFFNKWEAITIYKIEKEKIVGCSVEGHISHIFSNRFSSRPKGWCENNLSILSRLIVYKLNGGDIATLVSKRRECVEEDSNPEEKSVKKKKIYKKAKSEYYRNTTLPVIEMGENTLLCKYLKKIRSA